MLREGSINEGIGGKAPNSDRYLVEHRQNSDDPPISPLILSRHICSPIIDITYEVGPVNLGADGGD